MIFKSKKYLPIIFGCILILAILPGCSENQVNENGMIPGDNSLMEKYSLESESIEIYMLGSQKPIIINDSQDIQLLQDTVSFDNWRYIDPKSGQTYEGIESIFVKFNDSTTIAMYNDIPYGLLGKGSPDELGNISNIDAYYTFPQEFLDTVLQMIEKYSK